MREKRRKGLKNKKSRITQVRLQHGFSSIKSKCHDISFLERTLCADWKHSLAFLTLRTGIGALRNIMPWMMKGAPPFSSGCLATIMSMFLKMRAS